MPVTPTSQSLVKQVAVYNKNGNWDINNIGVDANNVILNSQKVGGANLQAALDNLVGPNKLTSNLIVTTDSLGRLATTYITPNELQISLDDLNTINNRTLNLVDQVSTITNQISTVTDQVSTITDQVSTVIEDNEKSNSSTWSSQKIVDMIYPIGAIFMSVNNTNPSTYLGGTWSAWGSGRVPVGVDSNNNNFNTVEKTGGAATHTLTLAEIPSHQHSYCNPSIQSKFAQGSSSSPIGLSDAPMSPTTAVGGGQAHNNLQPYITCYMWKRTA